MQENSVGLGVLEIMISGPGVVYVICFTVICILLLITFSSNFRNFFASKKITAAYGKSQFEYSPTQLIDPVSKSEDAIGSVPIQQEEREDPPMQVGLTSDEGCLEEKMLSAEDEVSLKQSMFYFGYLKRDSDSVEEIYEKLRSLSDRQMSDEELATLRCDIRLDIGLGGSGDELKELERENSSWVQPSISLVKFYTTLSHFELAIEHARTALQRSESESQKAQSLLALAGAYQAQDRPSDALELLDRALANMKEDYCVLSLLDRVFEIHKKAKSNVAAAKALEFALTIEPGDKDRRFRLAYYYAETNRRSLALFHYSILENLDPRYDSLLNNLGALYESFELHESCVSCWARAVRLGHAYPAGNLAIKLLKSGFFEEAKKFLDDLPVENREDTRVIHAMKLLGSEKEKEAEGLRRNLEVAKVHHKYMLLATESERREPTLIMRDEDLAGEWRLDHRDTTLKIELTDEGVLQGTLLEKRESFFPLSVGSGHWKFCGSFHRQGRSITGRASWAEDTGRAATLLGGGPTDRNFFLVLTNPECMTGFYWTDVLHTVDVVFSRT